VTKPSVQRIFQVDAPLEEAWHRLAEVERWPEWAPHIISLSVSPPGELGPTSPRAFKITRLGRNTFRSSAWDRPVRSEWVGDLPGSGLSRRPPGKSVGRRHTLDSVAHADPSPDSWWPAQRTALALVDV
jgi:hypothetical protein